MRIRVSLWQVAALAVCVVPSVVQATPYASNVQKSGTTVTFTLNETADSLTYKINGGAPQVLSGATIGTKTFNLGSATDTFSISAEKTAAAGYTIPLAGQLTLGTETNGWKAPTQISGTSYIHDENNALTRFNSPRGVSVSLNPNAPNFGVAYVSNSQLPTATFAARPGIGIAPDGIGEGIFAIGADGSDVFGYGDAGKNPIVTGDTLPAFSNAGANSPFRVTVNSAGQVLVADFYDNNSNAFVLNSNLTTAQNFFPGYVGTTPPGAGQNHGSTTAVYSTGSLATGDLKVYTLDEDLSSQFLIDGTAGTDRNSLWRYDIGSGPLPSNVTPVKVNVTNNLLPAATSDLDFGADGKIYVAQNRAAGLEGGIYVLDPAGNTIFNSLTASQTLLNNPAAPDIFAQTLGIAVSPDQKWMAVMINRSDVGVIPLVNGIPDIANRMVAITTTSNTENSGRDIAFDAAGNIHYVSSGQSRYRVLEPGGHTLATTSWDGTQYAFTVGNVVPQDADFNNDGIVDGADVLIFQQGLGISDGTALNSNGDANGDHNVTAADLAIVVAKFGGPTATAAAGAVPEPASVGLAAVGFALLAARRRARG